LHVNTDKNTSTKVYSIPKAQKNSKQTIYEILTSLNPQQKETVQNLRQLVRDTRPETVELIKQGKIIYKLEGRDFVWITYYRQHVDLEFAMGSSLSELLRSRGVAEESQNVHHVAIGNYVLQKPEIEHFVRDTSTTGFKHCATK